MEFALLGGLIGLILVGVEVIRLLRKIEQLLGSIQLNLPSVHYKGEDGQPDVGGFWRETQLSMNRLARIYDKVVLEKDYKGQFDELRGQLQARLVEHGAIAPLNDNTKKPPRIE